MATQHLSSAPPAPAASRPYRKARTGYGKRSVPGQAHPHSGDFAFLPDRERYVAGYVDRLPEGAAMDIKSLAKDLPVCGQMAIGTALRALGLAGHLRRVRTRVQGVGQCRWVTLTYWSRTARDNEWWTTFLARVDAAPEQAPAVAPAQPSAVGPSAAEASAEPVSGPTAEARPAPAPEAFVPRQRAEEPLPERQPEAPAPASPGPVPPVLPAEGCGPVEAVTPAVAEPSPAYLALVQLSLKDDRLPLSEEDCVVLEPLAAEWLGRGYGADHLISALTAGLPARVDSPVGLVRSRLTKKMPPRLPVAPAPAAARRSGLPGTPVRGLLVECTECGRPGRAEALPDGLCGPCRRTGDQSPEPAGAAAPERKERDVSSMVANLRNLMRTP
ncbi:MarR family transcriptional regulator [Streptomyces sp. NPDC002308]